VHSCTTARPGAYDCGEHRRRGRPRPAARCSDVGMGSEPGSETVLPPRMGGMRSRSGLRLGRGGFSPRGVAGRTRWPGAAARCGPHAWRPPVGQSLSAGVAAGAGNWARSFLSARIGVGITAAGFSCPVPSRGGTVTWRWQAEPVRLAMTCDGGRTWQVEGVALRVSLSGPSRSSSRSSTAPRRTSTRSQAGAPRKGRRSTPPGRGNDDPLP
jgi:hypothetical protein